MLNYYFRFNKNLKTYLVLSFLTLFIKFIIFFLKDYLFDNFVHYFFFLTTTSLLKFTSKIVESYKSKKQTISIQAISTNKIVNRSFFISKLQNHGKDLFYT